MMASGAGGGAAGEGEWLMVAQLRATVQAQDPRAKVSDLISPPIGQSYFPCCSCRT